MAVEKVRLLLGSKLVNNVQRLPALLAKVSRALPFLSGESLGMRLQHYHKDDRLGDASSVASGSICGSNCHPYVFGPGT